MKKTDKKQEQSKKGFKRLEYNGIPVLIREWFPKNKIGFYNEKKQEMIIVDIENRETQVIKNADFYYKI